MVNGKQMKQTINEEYCPDTDQWSISNVQLSEGLGFHFMGVMDLYDFANNQYFCLLASIYWIYDRQVHYVLFIYISALFIVPMGINCIAFLLWIFMNLQIISNSYCKRLLDF